MTTMPSRSAAVVAVLATLVVGASEDVLPQRSRVILTDLELLSIGEDGLELGGASGTFVLQRLMTDGGPPRFRIRAASAAAEVTLDDLVLTPPTEGQGVRWSARTNGLRLVGDLRVAVQPDESPQATIWFRDDSPPPRGVYVEVSGSEVAARHFIGLCERTFSGESQQQTTGVHPGSPGQPAWPWTWYCGCTWEGNGMMLCPPNWCPPNASHPCGPNDWCHWFWVWGVTSQGVDTQTQSQ